MKWLLVEKMEKGEESVGLERILKWCVARLNKTKGESRWNVFVAVLFQCVSLNSVYYYYFFYFRLIYIFGNFN